MDTLSPPVNGSGAPASWCKRALALALACSMLCAALRAQVPGLINYQGRVAVGRTDFEGNGQFKLALVNASGTQLYWGNDADTDNDGVPDRSVTLSVSRGLFSVQLGDTSIPNMAPLSLGVFAHSEVFLRVWFSDGNLGFQRLTPDQRVASVGYAMMAGSVPDGTITPSKIAPGFHDVIATLSNRLNAIEALIPSGLTLAAPEAQDDTLTSQGFEQFTSIAPGGWADGSSTGAPGPRQGHSSVWTGEEMVIWGGLFGPGLYSGSGAIYHPGLDQWRAITAGGSPAARSAHTAVWTGQEMIVWGGFSTDGFLQSGARLNPVDEIWRPIPLTGAPSARDGHAAVWIGNRMAIFGGRNADGLLGDSFLYEPVSEQWSSISLTGAPSARSGAAMIWTGDLVIVWGGEGTGSALGTGARLVFNSNGAPSAWSSVTAVNAPSGRSEHTAVWTGQRMIVWGGQNNGALLGDGAAYDPASNSWQPLPALGAPAPRRAHNAIWTGQEMIIVGGETAFGAAASGAAFNPSSGKWRELTLAGNPQTRAGATTLWTGTELLVFGGRSGSQPLASLERLNPQPTWYLYRKP